MFEPSHSNLVLKLNFEREKKETIISHGNGCTTRHSSGTDRKIRVARLNPVWQEGCGSLCLTSKKLWNHVTACQSLPLHTLAKPLGQFILLHIATAHADITECCYYKGDAT
jgi:hypothetical protein